MLSLVAVGLRKIVFGNLHKDRWRCDHFQRHGIAIATHDTDADTRFVEHEAVLPPTKRFVSIE